MGQKSEKVYMRLITMLSLLLSVSCASVSNSPKLKEIIAAEEVRSLKEIKNHSQFLLESHPEIKENNKIILEEKINEVLRKQQELRDQESKIIQALINKTLSMPDQSDYNDFSRSKLEKELNSNYENKYKNIYSLVSLISEMSSRNETSSTFNQDIGLLIREIR